RLDMNPLIDVALVLLVVFIATAPLLSSAVTVNPAQAADSALQQPRTVAVSIDEDGKIFIDRSPVELAALEAQLRQLSAGSDEVSVRLDAHEAVNYGIVAKAISAIERGGIERLSVMTASE
ncbi:MAG: biopolymer transporter ExbD, partial [Polyangiaceae bacterium]